MRAATRCGTLIRTLMDVQQARARILSLSFLDATVQSADIVPAGPLTVVAPGGLAPVAVQLPAHVRVKVVVPAQINVEVWLPTENWNERFQGVGGGGLAGQISYAALASALQAGFAAASTDTGHVGNADALWAIGRPDLLEDYGHRAIHEMTLKAKSITRAFYGRAPHHAYFTGCSTGGRQGLMEAQRYPGDYDGILSGAPAINISTFHAGQVWAMQHTLADPTGYITAEQYATINQTILDAWDAHDGVADGVIDDPRQVVVDYAMVQSAAALSDRQLAALRALYEGPVNSAGEHVYPGLMPGGETLWQPLVGGPLPFPLGPAIYGHMVFEDATWDWRTFTYDADLTAAREKLGAVMDAMSPDLSTFRAHGGKLILYHGWSDFGISPEATRRYYDWRGGGQRRTRRGGIVCAAVSAARCGALPRRNWAGYVRRHRPAGEVGRRGRRAGANRRVAGNRRTGDPLAAVVSVPEGRSLDRRGKRGRRRKLRGV